MIKHPFNKKKINLSTEINFSCYTNMHVNISTIISLVIVKMDSFTDLYMRALLWAI